MEELPSAQVSADHVRQLSLKRSAQCESLDGHEVKVSRLDDQPKEKLPVKNTLQIVVVVACILSKLNLKEVLAVRSINRVFNHEGIKFIQKKSRASIHQKSPYKETRFCPDIEECPLANFLELLQEKREWDFPIKFCCLIIDNPRDKNFLKLLDFNNLVIDNLCLTEYAQGSKAAAAFFNILNRVATTIKDMTLLRVPSKALNKLSQFPEMNSLAVIPTTMRYYDGIRDVSRRNFVSDEGVDFIIAFIVACPHLRVCNLPNWMYAEMNFDSVSSDSDSD